MCGGCGRVPKSVSPVPTRDIASRADRSARESLRKSCPKCHRRMRAVPDGSMVCRECAITKV